MSGYRGLGHEYDPREIWQQFWEWVFPPAVVDPYTQCRRELHGELAHMMFEVRSVDGKLAALYGNFNKHVHKGKPPQIEHFVGAATWYKQNRDEMHELITKLLVMQARAREDPAKFVSEWETMPEEIRQCRRKWEQKYTPENVVERDVNAAFAMPVHARHAYDDETDAEL